MMISNITKYKTLHLHRTFHFKTLRDLSEGKEIFFVCLFLFCLFPSEENTLEWNRMLPSSHLPETNPCFKTAQPFLNLIL